MKKFLLSILIFLTVVPTVSAAKAPDPYCTLTTSLLSIYNLDPDVPFAITYTLTPIGTTIYSDPDGTYEVQNTYVPPLTIYVWVRGHGPSLIKVGKQVSDYHVIALCSLT